MDIKIIVAAHKPYDMPKDSIYLPVHVGAHGKESIGYQRDDEGENISQKNPAYCELTGIYWAWKNLKADYVGLAHYRRHFGKSRDKVLDKANAQKLLQKADVIVPVKRKYYIENLYSHYVNTLHADPLDKTFEIIEQKYPRYYPAMQKLHTRTSAHMFNMFIMKKEHFDNYCQWLFDILGELENRVDSTQYDTFHARFYGRVSELLLDVWLDTNGVEAIDFPFVYMEKINWFKKGKSFLMAKFFKKKYDKSF